MNDYREVYFDKYCKTCKYFEVKEEKDPCHFCLAEPINLESHKPVYWEERK